MPRLLAIAVLMTLGVRACATWSCIAGPNEACALGITGEVTASNASWVCQEAVKNASFVCSLPFEFPVIGGPPQWGWGLGGNTGFPVLQPRFRHGPVLSHNHRCAPKPALINLQYAP